MCILLRISLYTTKIKSCIFLLQAEGLVKLWPFALKGSDYCRLPAYECEPLVASVQAAFLLTQQFCCDFPTFILS